MSWGNKKFRLDQVSVWATRCHKHSSKVPTILLDTAIGQHPARADHHAHSELLQLICDHGDTRRI